MNVAFRADASAQIGSGHVQRCLTLARELRELGAAPLLLSRDLPPALRARAERAGVEVVALPAAPTEAADADATRAALESRGGVDWLVADHYGLGGAWQRQARTVARRVLAIDDLAADVADDLDADIVLNANLGATAQAYDGRVPARAALLVGPRYALLRPEFARLRAAQPPRDGGLRRVLVSLGGADAPNHTAKVLEALREPALAALQVDVVVGALNPHLDALQAAVRSLPDARLHRDVDDLAERMAQADLCVGAGGTTSWERACLGLPTVVLSIADNQLRPARALAAAGCALHFEAATVSAAELGQAVALLARQPELLRAMGLAAAALTDGYGARRVARRMLPPAVTLRPATAADSDTVRDWRNAPEAVRNSLTGRAVTHDEHARWYPGVLNDPMRLLWIAEWRGERAGVLRYDISGAQARVSIQVAPGLTGRGLGPAMLQAGTERLARERPGVTELVADILPGNAASQAAFAEAGYTLGHSVYRRKVER